MSAERNAERAAKRRRQRQERDRRLLPLVREPYPEGVERPRVRGDCASVPRPCPFVSCRWHTYLTVDQYGGLTTQPGEPWELAQSCALDVAEQREHDLREVGEILGVSTSAVWQTEVRASKKLDILRECLVP